VLELKGPLDHLSIGWLLVVTIVVVLAAVEAGYRVGRHRKRTGAEHEAPLGTAVGAALALLAFVLAFTFGMAASRYDTRRELLQREANAIGTTYLRTGFLPEPVRGELRAMLREYTEARLSISGPGDLETAIRRSEDLHGRMWAVTERVAPTRDSPLTSLFVQSLNETIDLHALRKTLVLWAHIPTTIWLALYIVAIVTMGAMGYYAGVAGTTRSVAGLAVVLSFAVVIALIADLDRPREGLLRANQQPLLDLQRSLTR
jgi:hypothetical protein